MSKKIEAQKEVEDGKIIYYARVENSLKYVCGKVLTLIDASIPEERQNKALKDQVKDYFRSEIFNWQEFYWEGKQGHSPIMPD